jgi:secreted PhoX family phosphatase
VSVALILVLGLQACRSLPAPPPPPPVEPSPPAGLELVSVELPASSSERSVVASASWNGRSFPLSYQPLITVGQQHGEAPPVSAVLDARGLPVLDDSGRVRECNALDGASLLQSAGALFSVVHSECYPGSLQLSELSQDTETGALSLSSTAAIDLSSVDGGGLFCAADVSPWGTHMAAEEYEPAAERLLPDGTLDGDWMSYNDLAWYQDLGAVSPYSKGWMLEVQVEGPGRASVTPRYAMGRFSHEQSRVMPDGRTVYLSDDGTNGAFFVFVADAEGDLSAGRLYASRWEQRDPRSHELSWIDLGHATDAQVQAALDEGVVFADLLERSEDCAEGFTPVRTMQAEGCLRVVEGREAVASRLESRKVAATLGATTEFRKAEGMAFDAERRRVWLAVSKIERGLLDGDADWDIEGVDHLRMEPNRCGVVLELDGAGDEVLDASGRAIDSDWIVTRSRVVLAGEPVDDEVDACAIEAISNPDNLVWIPELQRLVIAEDSRNHHHNALWLADLESSELTRLVAAPHRAELAGLNWFPDVNGWGYLTLSFQHEDRRWLEQGEEMVPSHSGVLGPWPVF